MTKPFAFLTIIAGFLLVARPASAELFSFETGTLAGWSSLGDVSVVGTVALPPDFELHTVVPTDGASQALLGSLGVSASALEVFFGLSSGYLANTYTRGSGLARTFDLGLGDVLSFNWDFVAGDSFPFNDASLFIRDGAGSLLSSVELVGDFATTTYQTYSFTAGATGPYTIGMGVFNAGDQFNASYLLLDNFNLTRLQSLPPPTTEVPEPATLLLLTLGSAGALAGRRRVSRK